jgi:hypothetical protein
VQRLAERQRDFSAAILDLARPVPAGLVGPGGEPSPRRFSVYRNNVVSGLTDTLAAAFPAVCRIVGEAFFRAMARCYIFSTPPNSPILLNYGAGFPDFIAGFGPAATLPYLRDVARIERAWSEAYHSAEAMPLDRSAFANIAPERSGDLRLALHPSLRIVRSRLPALTIWRMNVADGVAAPLDMNAGGEDALVIRPGAEVEVLSMPPGGAEFVAKLAAGAILTEAFEAGIADDPTFDLAANLQGLIGTGAVVGCALQEIPGQTQGSPE